MNIIISGCGNVGYHLARTLMKEGHNVTVIDADPEVCQRVSRQLDVLCLQGSGMDLDVKVAVMGCVVNGPGEARSADIGIAGGIGEGLLIKKGEIIKKVPENELLSVLREELLKMQEMQKYVWKNHSLKFSRGFILRMN